MDCRLPPHPKCLSGRSFDQLHVVRHPDKPDIKAKYTAQLYISRIQPPVIKVVLAGTIYVFPPDQRNFYHALLMFFYFYHKQDETIRFRYESGVRQIEVSTFKSNVILTRLYGHQLKIVEVCADQYHPCRWPLRYHSLTEFGLAGGSLFVTFTLHGFPDAY
ncbi:unnamed protein product [Dibothriocephalus latus]|uniref:Uncharacterized protein n=1 Tax=Dibothriocephalus latus TaxID=60516 RepID=A0A3P6UIR9_DIBLA|nr:unnamed protein product [Dibothriocephalus latus]